jgi:hypothetical protein
VITSRDILSGQTNADGSLSTAQRAAVKLCDGEIEKISERTPADGTLAAHFAPVVSATPLAAN